IVDEGEGEGEGALVPVEEGADEDDVAVGVTPAACFEPKIADAMLPKMLILSSCRCLSLAPAARPVLPALPFRRKAVAGPEFRFTNARRNSLAASHTSLRRADHVQSVALQHRGSVRRPS